MDIAAHLNLSPGQMSKRLSGSVPFRAHEIQDVAAFLGVKPGLFYLPVDEVVERLSSSGYNMTPLEVVEPGLDRPEQLQLIVPPALASV